MTMLVLIRRDLGHYFGTRSGWVIASVILLLQSLLYNVHSLANGSRYSSEVIADFFFDASGATIIAALLVAMRLFAEERQTGRMPLLATAPLSDRQLVFAKFAAGYLFLLALIGATVYMPLLVFLHGEPAIGHILAGYLGLALLGAAVMAIGTLGSALATTQAMAILISSAVTVALLLAWLGSRVVSGDLSEVVSHLSLHSKHFRPFMEGTIELASMLYYGTLTAFFLHLSALALEASRWRP